MLAGNWKKAENDLKELCDEWRSELRLCKDWDQWQRYTQQLQNQEASQTFEIVIIGLAKARRSKEAEKLLAQALGILPYPTMPMFLAVINWGDPRGNDPGGNKVQRDWWVWRQLEEQARLPHSYVTQKDLARTFPEWYASPTHTDKTAEVKPKPELARGKKSARGRRWE